MTTYKCHKSSCGLDFFESTSHTPKYKELAGTGFYLEVHMGNALEISVPYMWRVKME